MDIFTVVLVFPSALLLVCLALSILTSFYLLWPKAEGILASRGADSIPSSQGEAQADCLALCP